MKDKLNNLKLYNVKVMPNFKRIEIFEEFSKNYIENGSLKLVTFF